MSTALPPGWEMKHTAEGRPFYVNHATKKTQWNPPEHTEEHADPAAAPAAAAAPVAAAPVAATPVAAAPMRAATSSSSSSSSGGLLEMAENGGLAMSDIFALADATAAHFGSEWKVHESYFLYIPLNGMVYTKRGSMVGYTGTMKFERGSGGGLSQKLMKSMTGEGASMMKAKGEGQLFIADNNKNIVIINLNNESIIVNGNDLLAFEESLTWKVTMMKGASGMMSGGLFNVKVSGVGRVAIGTVGKPLLMRAGPSHPIATDPQSTVAWSGTLDPKLKTDVSFKSVLGKGSGEEFQMKFSGPGDGFVIVQPFEEIGHAQ